MSFFWGPSAADTAFTTELERTTSELLPSSSPPDLVTSLQLADQIRSSAVTPQTAAKALLARLTHANPNVQLLALSVVDICIKNGGTPFLVQIGARDFANELEKLARGKVDGNRDVKERVMAKLQDWATAFEQMDKLKSTELVRSYERLKNEGLPFPAKDATITAALVDSLSAPEWTDSTYCSRCRTDFSTFNRKHHCRNCGDVFDQQCSSQTHPLPHFGVTEPVRICDGCAKKLKEGKPLARSTSLSPKAAARPGLPERSNTVSHKSSYSTSSKTSKRSKEDDDLQKAIAASLLDAGPSSGPAFELRHPPPAAKASGYNPSYPGSTASTKAKQQEEDDPDLAAAIAASLRDAAPLPSAPGGEAEPAATYASLYPSQQPSSISYDYATPSSPSVAIPTYVPAKSLPTYNLSPVESSSLNEFVSTLEHPPPTLGTRERVLYDAARAAAPSVHRGMQDAQRRTEILVEMNQKLSEATRLYEGMLEERVNRAYTSHHQPSSSYSAAPSYPASSQPHHTYSHPPLPPQQVPQPLPPSVMQSYASYAQPAPPQLPHLGHPSHAHPEAAAPPQSSSQHHPQYQQQQQQPAGYYKPSSFPAVPQTQPVFLPTVPTENPWEQQQQQREEETKVGELIEL